jgi:hypothetical protein
VVFALVVSATVIASFCGAFTGSIFCAVGAFLSQEYKSAAPAIIRGIIRIFSVFIKSIT